MHGCIWLFSNAGTGFPVKALPSVEDCQSRSSKSLHFSVCVDIFPILLKFLNSMYGCSKLRHIRSCNLYVGAVNTFLARSTKRHLKQPVRTLVMPGHDQLWLVLAGYGFLFLQPANYSHDQQRPARFSHSCPAYPVTSPITLVSLGRMQYSMKS